MITKRIIPCLDVTGGRVVKGTHFVDLKDAGDPVLLAKKYNDEGADELVFLDITASSDERNIFLDIVYQTAKELFIPLTVGGGIRSVLNIQNLLNAGADKVSINSAIVHRPELVCEAVQAYGSQCIVAAIDIKAIGHPYLKVSEAQRIALDRAGIPRDLWCTPSSEWEVYTKGGRVATGIDGVLWAGYVADLGAGELLITSMDRDGSKMGYDLAALAQISGKVSTPVIASGGAGALDHIVDVLQCCDAALVASLLHYGQLTIGQIKDACQQKGMEMRV